MKRRKRKKKKKTRNFLLETPATSGSEYITSSRVQMSSVWHRPLCNIGPGISPVTIGTMDHSRKRPGSPGLTSSTRRRRANDEINAHRKLVIAMTAAAVVVVASVTSSVTHTMLASDIRRSINEKRSRRLDWEDHCEDLDERDPNCFGRQYRMPQQTKKLADILLRLQPLRDRRFLARSLAR